MKLCEIIKRLEKEFPKEAAYEWDNVGLLVGDKNRDIKKIALALDVTEDTVDRCIEESAELIVSHHPIMFSPVNKITKETALGRLLIKAIENKISIYAAHTNCDVAGRGINAYLADLFELQRAEVLEDNGLGRVGDLKEEMSLDAFCEIVKEKLNTPAVQVVGDIKKKVKRIAIGSGACSDSIPFAIEKNADVMITGDTKYHNMLNFAGEGISIIDAGHYPTEIVVLEIFEKVLEDLGIEMVKYRPGNVIKFI